MVTGAAGFIGAHCVLRLTRDGHRVCGLDTFLEICRCDPVRYLICASSSSVSGFTPGIELDEGLGRFIQWFLDYYPLPVAHAPLAAELQRRSL
nr:NAD-dependent epimerase/dehydratase family protein [Pseudomonas sp. RGM2987]